MKNRLIYLIATVLVVLIAIVIALPSILKSLGFHPDYEGEEYDLTGKKALIVTTSHGVLNKTW